MLDLGEISQHLRKSQFLEKAPDDLVHRLADAVRALRIPAGKRLIEKGALGTSMFFVVDGCVRIHDGDVVLTHLGQGEVFGEIGALAAQNRTASVTAEIDSLLLELDQEVLYHTLTETPGSARPLIEALCRREGRLIHDVTERSVQVKVLEHEMSIAKKIQKSFLPETIPDISGWDMKGYLEPAREVAGDFYDYFVVPRPNCVGIVIGDVCDKGVGAALFMTLFRSLIRSTALFREFVEQTDAPKDVASTLRDSITLTNRYIATTHGSSSMFSSVFFGLLIPETGQLCYINAGHESPVIVGDQGIRVHLETTGPVIGLFPEIEHEVRIAQIQPGETLVAYTDGVTDAKNPQGAIFSEERLLSLIAESPRQAGSMLHRILGEIHAFAGNASQYDDTTLIVVHRKPVTS